MSLGIKFWTPSHRTIIKDSGFLCLPVYLFVWVDVSGTSNPGGVWICLWIPAGSPDESIFITGSFTNVKQEWG